jgi:hypothetical protein
VESRASAADLASGPLAPATLDGAQRRHSVRVIAAVTRRADCWIRCRTAGCAAVPALLNISVCDMVVCMAQVDRFSVTMPPDLGEGVRRAAERQGISVSAWLSEAAADRLRNELLGAALDAWESEDGSFTEAELDAAASRLGLAPRPDVA